MSKAVVEYVASCDDCQRNKSRTTRRAGKLHPLPVSPRLSPTSRSTSSAHARNRMARTCF
jgi:hypothetical protein